MSLESKQVQHGAAEILCGLQLGSTEGDMIILIEKLSCVCDGEERETENKRRPWPRNELMASWSTDRRSPVHRAEMFF